MEDVAARAPAVSPRAMDAAREQLEALLQEIAGGGAEGRTAAGRLPDVLKVLVRQPTPETAEYLRGLLEAGTLDGLHDAQGRPCRAAVIQAQIALGFPYALEVNPDDLVWLRAHASSEASRSTPTRIATVILGLISLVWGAGTGVLISELGSGDGLWLAAPFFVGAAHALVAIGSVALARPDQALETRRAWATVFRWLGKMVWLGPLTSVVAAAIASDRMHAPDTFVAFAGLTIVGLACAMPAMLTAALAGATGKRLVPEDEDPPPVPRR